MRPLLRLVTALLMLAALAAPSAARPPDLAGGEQVPVGVWPLQPEPEVLEGFDPPEDPWGSGHRGVDLAGSQGQVVRAAMAGRISFAGVLAGRGVVVVDHGDTRTTYEPVVAKVVVGDRVGAGDPIGRLELRGSHCLPRACLHWGWRRGDVYLDPLLLVGGGPIRLLPLWRDRPADVAGSGATPGLVSTWPVRPPWW